LPTSNIFSAPSSLPTLTSLFFYKGRFGGGNETPRFFFFGSSGLAPPLDHLARRGSREILLSRFPLFFNSLSLPLDPFSCPWPDPSLGAYGHFLFYFLSLFDNNGGLFWKRFQADAYHHFNLGEPDALFFSRYRFRSIYPRSFLDFLFGSLYWTCPPFLTAVFPPN